MNNSHFLEYGRFATASVMTIGMSMFPSVPFMPSFKKQWSSTCSMTSQLATTPVPASNAFRMWLRAVVSAKQS